MTLIHGQSRRRFLQTTAGIAAATLVPVRRAFAGDLAVGFIYVGAKDDYGYNQAHAEGAAAVKTMGGVSVVEEENVAETVDVQKTMESMINFDGAALLLPGC
jgi:basic membrane protein A and related proteins